jgi:predicted RNase H-like nuclease (RuvC/YqgF family)
MACLCSTLKKVQETRLKEAQGVAESLRAQLESSRQKLQKQEHSHNIEIKALQSRVADLTQQVHEANIRENASPERMQPPQQNAMNMVRFNFLLFSQKT